MSGQPSRSASPTEKRRVLVVEDDASSANALRLLLTYQHFDVTLASTLSQAIALLDETFHAIVLDLMLPDGDGTRVLEEMARLQLSAKVVVTTAVSDRARLSRVNLFRPHLVLTKPIVLAELLQGLGSNANGDPAV